jgi:hypothetical protein
VRAGYAAPILPAQTLPEHLGRTLCSYNNLPIVEIDPEVLKSMWAESTIVHEQVHASHALAYRGGCWAYMRRYGEDKPFRVREQMAAFCAGAQVMLVRNADPRAAWQVIVDAMAPDTVLTDKDNCVYQPW